MQLLMKKLEPAGTVLDQSYAVSVILYLYENGTVAATDLLDVVKNYTRMKALADSLVELGLVEMNAIKTRNVEFQYTLTAKGRKVAERLIEAVDLISS